MEVGFGDRRDSSFGCISENLYTARGQGRKFLPTKDFNEIFVQQVSFPVVADRPERLSFVFSF